MKKQVSFIMRLTSLILTFLLLFTMTIGTGITTVFAKEYKESSYLDVAELAAGDILGANSVIHRTYKGGGYTVLDAYFNGTKMYSNDDSVYLEHKMILLSISPDPNRSDKAIMEFADYGSGVEADSEDTLRSNLNNVDAITLSDDIAINSPIAISGQKTRIINTNGHTLSLNADKGGSLFIVTGGSTLILKDDSEAGGAFHVNDDNIALSSCEITGNSADGIGGGVYVDPRYNVTLRGKMIIKDNTSGKGAGVANLALDKSALGKARIINAGLSKGSDVHFGSTASGDIQVSEWMSEYQMQYFTADEGRKFRNESRTVDASVVVSASIFSGDGLYAVILLGGVGVIATVLVIIFYRKKAKKGGEENA